MDACMEDAATAAAADAAVDRASESAEGGVATVPPRIVLLTSGVPRPFPAIIFLRRDGEAHARSTLGMAGNVHARCVTVAAPRRAGEGGEGGEGVNEDTEEHEEEEVVVGAGTGENEEEASASSARSESASITPKSFAYVSFIFGAIVLPGYFI